MVRPNQIIDSDVENGKLIFIMFARSEEAVKRRVLFLNFPGQFIKSGLDTSAVTEVQLMIEGNINRYAVTVEPAEL